MSSEQIQQLFDTFDANNDNKLSQKEVYQMFVQIDIKMTQEEFEIIFNLFDQDLNGYLTRSEFTHMIFVIQNCNINDPKSLLFYAADVDHSMRLDVSELKSLFLQLGFLVEDSEIKQIVEEMGVGNQLNYIQFLDVFNQIYE